MDEGQYEHFIGQKILGGFRQVPSECLSLGNCDPLFFFFSKTHQVNACDSLRPQTRMSSTTPTSPTIRPTTSIFATLDLHHATLADVLTFRAALTPNAVAYSFIPSPITLPAPPSSSSSSSSSPSADAKEAAGGAVVGGDDNKEGAGAAAGPGAVSLTYKSVLSKATVVAAWLQRYFKANKPVASNGVGMVLLLYPFHGVEFVVGFWGCILAGYVPVPVSPLDPSRLHQGVNRFIQIAQDCQSQVVLTTREICAVMPQLATMYPPLSTLHFEATETLPESVLGEWVPPQLSKESPAYVQFTSGTCGLPRPVVVRHEAAVNNAWVVCNRLLLHTTPATAEQPKLLAWLPFTSSMALLSLVVMPLCGGCASYVMSPVSFLANPLRWLMLISEIKANITIAPPFAYQVASSLPPSELERIDLSSLSTAIITGDSISAALLEKCRQSFSVCHLKRNVLLPMYTIAEATFLVSMHQIHTPPCVVYVRRSALQKLEVDVAFCFGTDTRSVVSCGTPTPPATSVCIVDIKTHEEVHSYSVLVG
ncbi:fatty acyl-AMP ligase [Pelomyxa schiedti]|nr:fatty acyl-AMP ligase [Pelomyxa schiedti]